jgi:hypothetical protein
MLENSGGQSNSTAKPHHALAKGIPVRAITGVLVIVSAVGGLWLAFTRGAFAWAWTNPRALLNSPSRNWWMGALFGMLGVLGVLILWKVPQWQVAQVEGLKPKDRFDKQNEARKTLATILGGVAFFVTAVFTWQNFELTQEGQITDRYTKAIKQLGAVDSRDNPKLGVRLGAIYSLEAIANESSAFHWPVMEVLCTYVRINAPAVEEQPDQNSAPVASQKSPNKPTMAQEQRPRADVLAILTVLGRRNAS